MILAVLQARMGSTRLPGKSMATLRGEPMIIRQLERLRGARCLSKIIVATSADTVDDALAGFLVSRGYTAHRGAGADILARIARCAETISSVSHVVRLKGDAPFIDPGVIDEAVRLALASGADYTSNRVRQTYPAGLEVEVIKAGALQAAAAEERDPMARISPTAAIRSQPGRWSQAHLTAPRDWSRLDWRVKTAADLAFARSVYDALHPVDPGFRMNDVLDLIGSRQDIARFAA
ncbi:acylneuraminate cytidylyltransferase [Caulobacter segnis]|uniref:Acylneuraminate cytidylyltransferase n=2 Tax=Caulobacter segnis TaxID=88688 RepID=D5VPP9_CAUST|nr:NTP transferase domain-containing protein [Caulobacter segnis]ADG12472.1 acylneuraminate cytidylyltransferase [Caulobacter segnis ATCC 21756]AVQ04056.1 acylneuraminate cytidylyltransferase [Caulobacter segnis]